MYKKSFRKTHSRSQGKRKIVAIDPSRLIQKAQENRVQESYTPQHQFSDFALSDHLLRNIKEKGYISPSPIQDKVISAALQGRDIVGIANTGTGKTAAFLIPLINKMYNDRFETALIIAPTRELALQIQDELKTFTKGMNIFSVLCIGGVHMGNQVRELRKRPNVVIGTPGRLKDLQKQGILSFANCRNIVLDEVDRMLDMGFIHDVRLIMSALPKHRQSLFFSATLSPQIESIIQTFALNPYTVSVKSQETSINVDQDIIKTNGRDKLDVLEELLKEEEIKKAIIFGRTKWGTEKLSRQLEKRGITVVTLHGNKNQNQRIKALDRFKKNEVHILLATDIVARGIDVDDVSHVINYDLPETYDDYVHRIGRTGRNNKVGKAISFVD